MSIEIRIIGADAAETIAQLTGLTQGLNGASTSAIVAATAGETSTATPEPKAASTRKPRETKPAETVAEQASPAEDSSATAKQETGTSPTEPETPASEQIVDNDPPATKKLDFDKEVAPKVLGYVRYKGKAWVEEILSEFGVKRASDLDDDRLPELLETLEDRGGELPK